MKTDCSESPEIVVPLAQALKDARLVASLSIDEVAEKLNLSASMVRDIETNLIEILETEKYPVIYLRGYLTNYAKLVGLKSLENFAEYQQLATVPQQKKTLTTSQLIIPPPKKNSKIVSLSVVGIVAISALIYLFQKPSPPAVEPIASITEPAVKLPNNNSSVHLDIKKRVPEVKTETQLDAQPKAETRVVAQQQVESNSASSVVAKVEDTPATKIATPTAQVDAKKEVQPVQASTAVVEAVENKPVESVVATEILSLAFSAECWTEVFDATGKRVAYGLYKKGRVLKLSGVAPFKLKLGDPSVVEIQYQDQVIKGGFPPRRTARFNVPLS